MFSVYEVNEMEWAIVPSWKTVPRAKALLFQREGAERAAAALSRYLVLTKQQSMRHAHAIEAMHKEGV